MATQRIKPESYFDSPIGDPLASPLVHRLVWVTALTVFPLIWAGGLVTTTKAGMAVPDWPGTYGYNMFLYPWTTWFFGPWDLFIEHGHRLLGSLAGIWCLCLVAVTWIRRTAATVRVLAIGALLLVIVQGVMGGVRVLNVDREIARLHGCLGPAFFAYLVGLTVVTSRWWQHVAVASFWTGSGGTFNQEKRPMNAGSADGRIGELVWSRLRAQRFLTMVVLVLAYGQLIFGASMRHISEAADPSYFRVLVWFHVTGAICTAIATGSLWLAARCPTPGLSQPRGLLVGLVGLQFGLGLGTWVMKYNFPEWFADYVFAQSHRIVSDDFYQVQIVTAHVAVGSLILGAATFLLLRLWRAEHCLKALLGPSVAIPTKVASVERSSPSVAPAASLHRETLTPC
jgi:cytochrome c oxidase assembly protein subunit 15